MQREKASAWAFVDPPAFDDPAEPVDDGLPPHAAISRARTAMATMVRAVGGDASRGLRLTLSFIVPS
jgi:hypothetical protein